MSLGKMQGEAAGRTSEPSGQGEEASPQGLGGCHRLARTDARGPAGQVVGQDPVSSTGQALHRQPSTVGGEASRGGMVEPHAVLEIADGVLHLGVAAMVGLQVQGVAVSISDEGVIAVVGKQQSYARTRSVQRRLTGESTHGCMLMARRVVRTKTDWRLVRIA